MRYRSTDNNVRNSTPAKPACLRACSLGSAVHIRNAATSSASWCKSVGVTVCKFNIFTIERWRHRDPATREVVCFRTHGIPPAVGLPYLHACSIALHKCCDVLSAANAFHQLVDAQTVRAVERSACLGHQGQDQVPLGRADSESCPSASGRNSSVFVESCGLPARR